jgi:hypothetical protein
MASTEATETAPAPAAPETTTEAPVAPAAPAETATEPAPAPAAAADPAEATKEAPKEEETKEDTPEEASPIAQLWTAAQAAGHPEIWGVTLADPETHVPTQIVLQKYLNANDGDVAKAKDQLVKTLEWRAEMKPLELVKKAYSTTKFGGLGYVTSYSEGEFKSAAPEAREIFTWNIYGGVKSIDETFGNLEEYAYLSQPYHTMSRELCS